MTQLYSNFIYNEERRFVFAYVPKVACTNWKSLLRYMEGHENWLDSQLAHDKKNGGLRYLGHTENDEEILRNSAVKKYTMVRNPYSRVLSSYLNKIHSRLINRDKVDHFASVTKKIDAFRVSHLSVDVFPTVNFEVFLHWLSESSNREVQDEHWAPQNKLIRFDEVKYDFIGKFENIKNDSEIILGMMECNKKFPTHEDIKFPPTNAQRRLAEHYTPRAIILANQLYSQDFRDFGYDTWGT